MRILFALALLANPAMAQDAPAFDPAPVLACLDSDAAPDSCAGLAANACMEGEGGSSTVGMGFCLGAERDWWDDRLNTAYGEVMTRAEAGDAELDSMDAAGPRQAGACATCSAPGSRSATPPANTRRRDGAAAPARGPRPRNAR